VRLSIVAIGRAERHVRKASQQATVEIMRRNDSIIACSHHIYVVLFFAHIPFVVNHTFNATPKGRLQHNQGQLTLIFYPHFVLLAIK